MECSILAERQVRGVYTEKGTTAWIEVPFGDLEKVMLAICGL